MAITLSSRLILNSPILLIELFTIVLLGYISYGEVDTQYSHFVLGKMEAQAETIRTSLDPYLLAAIPIEQFSGFNTQAKTLFDSDADIVALRVVNQAGVSVFAKELPNATKMPFLTLTEDNTKESAVRYLESDASYRVVMVLNNKFGLVGQIEIETSKQAVTRVIDERFRQIVLWSVVLFCFFFAFVMLFDFLSESRPNLAERQKQIFNGAYFVSFALIVTVMVVAVVGIYNTGATAKAKALADSMAQRISAVLELNIDLQDISGINEAFRNYQSHHADISSLALITQEHRVLFSTTFEAIGKPYQIPADSYEYSVALSSQNNNGFYLSVTIPVEIVRSAILAQAKQFMVLLIACGLLSWVFLEASGALLSQLKRRTRSTDVASTEDQILNGLKLIKPAYFLIVFTSAMPMSFLPHLAKDMAGVVGGSYATATLPFTIYYFVFAAVLIPAGRFAASSNLKQMMSLGFITELVGLICIAFGGGYWLLTLGRIFSGFGQGVFLIGLNSYTLSITPKEMRTLGNTVKVNGRNAALISGTSIGALLYTYMNYQSLFLVASLINLIGMIYLLRLVPTVDEVCNIADVERSDKPSKIEKNSNIRHDLLVVLRDPEFLRTLWLVGIMGKIGVAGVVMFAIPLILTERGVHSADIGLVLMVFYIASIVVTHYASVVVDRRGASSAVLFLSTLVGGVGMLLMGITGIREWNYPDTIPPGVSLIASGAVQFNHWLTSSNLPSASYSLLVIGIILTGIANGLLSAPIMTHIDKTPVAQHLGNKAVAAVYLFLERAGHMVGPMVISGLLAFAYNTSLGITLFGIVTILFGLIFLFTSTLRQQRQISSVSAA